MGIGTLENYLKMEVLKIKFKKWNFEELFETEVLKMIKVWKVKVLKIKLKNWSFEKIKIGVLENYLKMESLKN